MWSYQAGWSRHREEEGERETEKEGNSLGVRPGHIGFSGESWSMFPGSWLTRGIGYKATRPPDWFVLSVTPAHAALSRNYSIYLRLSHSAPLAPFVAALSLHLSSAGYASIRSSISLPPSGPLSLSLSLSLSLVPATLAMLTIHPSFTTFQLTFRARLDPARLAFDLRRKKDRPDTTLRSLTARDFAILRRPDVGACDVRTCGKDGRFQQRCTLSRIVLIVR